MFIWPCWHEKINKSLKERYYIGTKNFLLSLKMPNANLKCNKIISSRKKKCNKINLSVLVKNSEQVHYERWLTNSGTYSIGPFTFKLTILNLTLVFWSGTFSLFSGCSINLKTDNSNGNSNEELCYADVIRLFNR